MSASGKYIFFLDSDAVLSRSALGRLVRRMESDPSVGIAGCRIINGYTRKLDQWFYQYSASTHERVEFDTYSFSAAGAMIRAEAMRDAGPFWDDLFIYNEEVDLSIRVLRAGYRIIYCPGARVYHTCSSKGRSGAATYWSLQIRNWIWIFYRYYSPFFRREHRRIHHTLSNQRFVPRPPPRVPERDPGRPGAVVDPSALPGEADSRGEESNPLAEPAAESPFLEGMSRRARTG